MSTASSEHRFKVNRMLLSQSMERSAYIQQQAAQARKNMKSIHKQAELLRKLQRESDIKPDKDGPFDLITSQKLRKRLILEFKASVLELQQQLQRHEYENRLSIGRIVEMDMAIARMGQISP